MKTKVNMKLDILENLKTGAGMLKISKTALIKILIKKFEFEHQKYIKLNTAVKYQEKDDESNWRKFHLAVSETEYERFTDMRKFCKMSFSLIVAFSIEQYLEQLLETATLINRKPKKMDNFPSILFPAYCFLGKKINTGYCYVVYWGYPEKLPRIY